MDLSQFEQNQDLSQLTTYKVGGQAKYFFRAKNVEDLVDSIKLAQANKLKYFIIGGGSNLLISDEEFDGLVIKIDFDEIKIEKHELFDCEIVRASAGVPLSKLVSSFTQNSFTGLEWAGGIPGTVGGAVRGNAGAFGGEMKDNILEVWVYDISSDSVYRLENDECNFDYRHSIFKENPTLIILDTIFKFEIGDEKEIQSKVLENIRFRQERHPMNFGSAGSVFKNIEAKNLSQKILDGLKVDDRMIQAGKIPAWFVVERLGLKGAQIGGAKISDKHVNFIVNYNNAKAQDIADLIDLIQQKANQKWGIEMQIEVQFFNF